MILVTGGTGNIGSEVVRLLGLAKKPVRVLTRSAKNADAFGKGVEVVVGDLTQPRTLDAAFAGVKKVLFVSPHAEETGALAGTVADAAKKAGVKHIVMNSSSTTLTEPRIAIGKWHHDGEEKLKASGIAWTMLRPGNFASNAMRWAGMIKAQGAVFGVNSSIKSAPIDPRDIGAVAAKALADDGHEGKTYVLTGSELMSAAEQVQIIGTAIGKTLKYVEVPDAGARAGMVKSGMPEAMVEAMMEMFACYRAEKSAPLMTNTVREVTGIEPRSFAVWARDNAAAFA